MASSDLDPLRLSEDDVPGAKLISLSPCKCKVPQLHRWLACRGVAHAGLRKADLVER